MRKITILDTTLRDGEQTPGFAFSSSQKVSVVRLLDELGVDKIEIGFPAASSTDIEVLKLLKGEKLRSKIVGLARARISDIDSVLDNGANVVNIFVPVSDVMREGLLGKSRDELVAILRDAISHSLAKTDGIEVTLADATRADEQFLIEITKGIVDQGIRNVTIADSVGVASPMLVGSLVSKLVGIVPELGIHLHNDLGLATGNALIAIHEGAKEVHTCVGGIGERAGDVSLEEIAVALKVVLGNEFECNLKLTQMDSISNRICNILGYTIPSNKPVLGSKIFTHESDIHIAGVLQDESMFEAFSPSLVGRHHDIVFGKLSGKRSISLFLTSKGLNLPEDKLNRLALDVKEITRNGNTVSPEKLIEMARTAVKNH